MSYLNFPLDIRLRDGWFGGEFDRILESIVLIFYIYYLNVISAVIRASKTGFLLTRLSGRHTEIR